MNIIISGQNVEITEGLRPHAVDQILNLENILTFVGRLRTEIVLKVEGRAHKVRIEIKTRFDRFVVTAESGDMYASISAAGDKIFSRLSKANRKQQTSRRKSEKSLRMMEFAQSA